MLQKRYFDFFVFLSILFVFSASDTSYAKSKVKDEFLKQKVSKGHNFTKIFKKAKYKPGRLLVRFAPKADKTQRNKKEKKQILNSLGGAKIKRNFKRISGLTLVKLPPGQSVKDALKLYNSREDILYAEPDYEIKVDSTFPNEIYSPGRFNDLWGMHNTGQTHPVYGGGTSYGTAGADIDAPEAWDIITDANDIIVAVIDSGVNYAHPDLAANMWKTIEEPNDANDDGFFGEKGKDDDGDGLTDEDSEGREPGDPNWTNDLFEDDDENGFANDIYGYDFS